MEFFVTGATGFVGSHVVQQFVEQEDDVIAFTRDRSNATHLPDAVTVVEGDIATKASMRETMAGVDGVFHIAGWYRIGPGPWRAEKAKRINVEGTRAVLERVDIAGRDSSPETTIYRVSPCSCMLIHRRRFLIWLQRSIHDSTRRFHGHVESGRHMTDK